MGQEEAKFELGQKTIDKSKFFLIFILVTRNYFDFQYVVGKGGFGKVKLFLLKRCGK